MSLAPGSRLGVYEVIALLGAGGMGEVYRARDTRLKREVAIKILPDAFASDPDRLARFQREAELLATLNHPNIASIYGVEEARLTGGSEEQDPPYVRAIVLELVDGPTLADRIAKGPIPLDEALPIARQIAEAMEAAHERGIIHRDLKPANIKLREDGTVKVLDFGLAKALDNSDVGRNFSSAGILSQSPTATSPAMTMGGAILGTAAYMSPEQARGKPVDRRTDIWSFGCVLFEMLTGRQPFEIGDTVSDAVAAILKNDPDWIALPTGIPPHIHALLRRCLQKDAQKRLPHIGVARLDIEQALEPAPATATVDPSLPTQPVSKRGYPIRAIPVVVTAIVASALTGVILLRNMRPSPVSPPVVRFSVTLGQGQQFSAVNRKNIAISRDGTRLAYVANGRLYVRSLSKIEVEPVLGTEGFGNPSMPVFSPDGESIAFFALSDSTIKKIAVTGGVAVTLCAAELPLGMSWDDAILFAQPKGIMRVQSDGGKAELIVGVKADEAAYGPQMLPDGQTVLFTLATGASLDRWFKAKIVAQSLTSSHRKTIIEPGTDARYLPTGDLVYALGGVLFAVPLDLTRMQAVGGRAPAVEGVLQTGGAGAVAAQYGVSSTGSLIYAPGPISQDPQLTIGVFDRSGGGQSLRIPSGWQESPRVSPDGKWLAFGTDDGKDANIWIHDLSGATAMRRLTFTGRNRFPVWSSDSRRVSFQSDREGDLGIFWQLADGTGGAERLTKADEGASHVPESWSPKGDTLLFRVAKGSIVTISTLSLPTRKIGPYGGVESNSPTHAVFSPDGRWVAYGSRDSRQGSRSFVLVQPFPATGTTYQISKSSEDGHHPVWSNDGRELYYVPGPGGQLAVVRVTTTPSFTFGDPDLIPMRFNNYPPGNAARNYDVGSDGKFVGLIAPGQLQAGAPMAPQIQVVLNWFEELKQKVPTR